jgi:copper transport protein
VIGKRRPRGPGSLAGVRPGGETRILLVALAIALAVSLAAAGPARAHALLEGTSPERGAVAATAPGQVVLRFSEPVEIAFGAVRVFASDGSEVQQGEPFHPGGRNDEVAVRLRDGVKDGGYTVTYRVVSADSHPVNGGFVFSVGDKAAAPPASVADLLGDQKAGPVTSVAFGVARAVEYGAIALGLGVLAVLLFVWLPALRATAEAGEGWREAASAFAGRARTLLLVAAGAGALAALAALALQAATAKGTSLWSALGGVREVLDTRFGVVWGLGILAWVLVGAFAAVRPQAVPALRPATVGAAGAALPGPGVWTWALAMPLLALALLPGLGGHAGVQDPVAVLLPANALHVLAAGAWIGGLAVLVVVLPAATRRLEPPDRTRVLSAAVGRFSGVALIAVALLLAGGIVQSLLELGAVNDLWDTPFGRAIAIKSALVVVLLALGALNRRRRLPRLRRAAEEGASPGGAGVLLRRTLRAEVALGIAALAVTGALAGYPPATAVGAGPFSGSADVGPARAELTVEPARAGANEVHVYLFDRSDGRQYDAPKEVRFEASLPGRGIEPIKLEATKAGPGHYVLGAAALSPPGDWRLELIARISDFDELRTTYTVPIE